MTRSKLSTLAIVLLVLLQGTSFGQNIVRFEPPSSPASWGLNTNWSDYGAGQNVPEGQFEEVALIASGATAQVSGSFPSGPGGLEVLDGTLEIQTGGLLTLTEPGGDDLVDRSARIEDVLYIQGGGQLLGVSTLTFGNASTYQLDVTSSTTSPLEVDGLASLGGTLNLDYFGFSTPGTRNLLSAGSIAGGFANVNVSGLGSGQTLAINTSGGVLSATLNNVPTLTINRQTGEATIENTHATGVSLDGYSIRSPLGALNPVSFAGLPRGGWDGSAADSSNVVLEVYEGPNLGSPSDSLPSSTAYTVGNAGFFTTPLPTFFLQETEELIFEITDPSYGPGPIRGVVNYVGDKVINNNIVLNINNAGEAQMYNQSPFSQNVEVYRISSGGNNLLIGSWNPLQDQSGLDNDTWQVSAQSDSGMLLEVTEEGSSSFTPFNDYLIGQILSNGNPQDITFEFLLEGEMEFTKGEVVFGDHKTPIANPGDFNNDGYVTGVDFFAWQKDPSVGSLTTWEANYGNVYLPGSVAAVVAAGIQSVPEPSSLALLGLFAIAAVTTRGKRG